MICEILNEDIQSSSIFQELILEITTHENEEDLTRIILKTPDVNDVQISRILESGRKKIADAIVNGKAIKIIKQEHNNS